MKSHSLLFFISMLILTLLFSACKKDSVGVELDEEVTRETSLLEEPVQFSPIIPTESVPEPRENQGHTPLECTNTESFGFFIYNSPGKGILVSETPTLQWSYAFGMPLVLTYVSDWDAVCTPDEYTVILSSGPEFTDELLFEVDDPSITIESGSFMFSWGNWQVLEWTIPDALDPVTVYRWTVIGRSGDVTIQDFGLQKLHSDEWWPPVSPETLGGTFRTGPECLPGATIYYGLRTPENNAIIKTLNPTLSWDPGEYCMPEGYLVRISNNQWFMGEDFLVNPFIPSSYPRNFPANYVIIQPITYPSLYVENILMDCQTYYWDLRSWFKVYGEVYWGNFSPTQSFSVDLGDCTTFAGFEPPPPPPPIEQMVTPVVDPTPDPSVTCSVLNEPACVRTAGCIWVKSKNGDFCMAK